MEISDSSSDDSLSFEEQIHLDTLSALAANTITTRLKEKMKTGLKSNVDTDNDFEDNADISCEAGAQFALNQKPLFDVLDTCNSSRGFYLFSSIDHQTSENEAIQEDDKNCRSGYKDENAERKEKIIQLASSLQCNIQPNSCYVTLNQHKSLQRMGSNARKDSEEEIMKKSVITDDFERKETIPPYEEGLRQMKKKRRLEREKTKGKNWFQMPAPEMTEERKHDLSILQMRKALDPKRFYKGNDIKALPRYFQFGEVVETPADFYHARIPKKHRKATIVDELLADVETRKYNKRKYTEIQEAKRKNLGPYRHMKRLKKKKH
ncbi:hypothetical protein CHS0354_038866 [Potamilus streckersoni]|uniref:Fcf2 pre-rRNA processing C-terminal domain-containing protein n=1 Tax=Potamilus streckersoni TaxID=2493646 RepID=A0AAE0SB46_9BIVA|nr:hypothetical protein CHS0354_038866 [Potamilus streckersoni]